MRSVRKKASAPAGKRIELGEYIVVDSNICHGKPTFKGTRIMVWQVLDELAHGMSPEDIVKAWGELVPLDAISETVQLARRSLLDKDGRLRSAKQALRASA